MKRVIRVPSESVILNWAPGLGSLLSDDQSHAFGAAVQELVGELGDPGSVTGLTIGLDGRGPG